MGSPKNIVLYSDFNCPFCYALDERLESMGRTNQIDWRGVQHAPELPVPMTQGPAWLASELAQEVRAIRALAPEVEISQPASKPNTRSAITAVAWAKKMNPEKAALLKKSFYREFWVQGNDISNPKIIQKLMEKHGLVYSEQELEKMEETISQWDEEWRGSSVGCVPAMKHADQTWLTGLAKINDLEKFFQKK